MSHAGSGYWYLASYPKSGNTWCRVFISELQRLSAKDESTRLNLNTDLNTGVIASSRHWLSDQLGINTCDLSFSELDPLRGKAGQSNLLFAETDRFHKVHDAFQSKDSRTRPVVSISNCKGAVYISRHPEDVAVSLSHFFDWDLSQCVESLLNPEAALVHGDHFGNHQVRQHMGRWDQHVNSWLDQTSLPVLAIRYEDMLANSFKTFSSLADFLNLTTEPELIQKAIDNTSIENLKQIESEVGGFKEKPKACKTFFRSGRSGEGAEKLSLEQRRRLFSLLQDTMARLDYEGPDNAQNTSSQEIH